MPEIRKITNQFSGQRGAVLMSTLVFVVVIGMISLSLISMVVSDTRMQVLNINERQAFYAAQSGVEYAIRRINEWAVANSNLGGLNSTETLATGNGTTCTVNIATVGSDSITITATGLSQGNGRTVVKGFNYIDVAAWRVYAGGTVTNVFPTSLIMQNAIHFPIFDINVLRDEAISNSQYYPGNLTLTLFSFAQNMIFVEGNLQLNLFLWSSQSTFVTIGNTQINPLIFGWVNSNFYMPTIGSTFQCSAPTIPIGNPTLTGGIITRGSVAAYTPISFWFFNSSFNVVHDRTRIINNLLQYSVNNGPLVMHTSSWNALN